MILRQYNAKVEVGLYHDNLTNNDELLIVYPIQLDGSGLSTSTKDVTRNPSLSDAVSILYSPIKILENLITAIIEASANNKEKIKQLRNVLQRMNYSLLQKQQVH
jgi:hypothetical protein